MKPVFLICLLIFSLLSYAEESATLEIPPPNVNPPAQSPTLEAMKAADELPWAALVYWGRTAKNTLIDVLEFNPGGYLDENIYSIELTRRYGEGNPIRDFLNRYLWAEYVELNGNLTYRDDDGSSIYELDPYFSVRWAKFPWDNYLRNSFAIGEGISYDTSVSSTEVNASEPGDTRNLLNYLMFEVTFALPEYPAMELALRVHHRSGVFGLYGADNSGSTALGLGLRYRF